jgi:serine/threonine protein kinase HipA of HipAB toxin-antitoxin module
MEIQLLKVKLKYLLIHMITLSPTYDLLSTSSVNDNYNNSQVNLVKKKTKKKKKKKSKLHSIRKQHVVTKETAGEYLLCHELP